MNLLHPLILLIAFLYAAVGFGGATGYLAVMSLFDIEPQIMASTALLLNVVVASISFIIYFRAGHLRRDLLLPFILSSVPAAFIGGFIKLQQQAYSILLYAVLTFVAIRLLFYSKRTDGESASNNPQPAPRVPPPFLPALLVGLLIGLISGMLGIGGGIFLSPAILYLGWGNSRQAAAVSAAFIVLNSISGLLGRFTSGTLLLDSFSLSLLPFGIIGALAGSWFGARHVSNFNLRRALGMVMAFAVINFWFSLFN